MDLVRRSLPGVGALGLLIIFGSLLRSPDRWLTWLVVSAALSGAAGWLGAAPSSGRRSHAAAASALLAAAAVGLLLFLSTDLSRQAFLLAVVVLCYLLWESNRRAVAPAETGLREQADNVSLLVNLAVAWVAGALFFRVLLDPTVLPPALADVVFVTTTAAFLAAVTVVALTTPWVARYERERTWPFTAVTVLVVAEVFWMLNFLPSSPDVKAFVVAATYYAFTMLTRAHLEGTISRRVVRRYAYLLASGLLVVLFTARWVA